MQQCMKEWQNSGFTKNSINSKPKMVLSSLFVTMIIKQTNSLGQNCKSLTLKFSDRNPVKKLYKRVDSSRISITW